MLCCITYSLVLHVLYPKGRNASQTVPGRKKRDQEGNDDVMNNSREDDENVKALAGAEKEELSRLREQVNDLQTKLSEKEEVLKSMEMSKNQVNEIHEKLEATKRLVAEKEMLIKSMQLQLSDTKVNLFVLRVFRCLLSVYFESGFKLHIPHMLIASFRCLNQIKLADKQAALEKTQWEAKTTGTRAIKLQEQLDAVEGDISTFTRVFETLAKPNSKKPERDYDATPYEFDHLPYLVSDVAMTIISRFFPFNLGHI